MISSRLGPFKRFTALWHLKLFLITYVLSSQSRGHAPGPGVKNKKTESQWGTLSSLGSNVLMFIIKILLNGLTDWGQILRVVSSLSLECPKENIIRIWLVSSWCMFNRKKISGNCNPSINKSYIHSNHAQNSVGQIKILLVAY